MQDEDIADDQLAALADGELSSAEEQALRAKIARNPHFAERYALFVETRLLLAPATETTEAADDAALARLAAQIRAAETPAPRPAFRVVDGGAPGAERGPARPASARPRARFGVAAPALAASLALVAGGLLGYLAGARTDAASGGRDAIALAGPAAAQTALASALERTKSGDAVAWTADGLTGAVTVVSSHKLEDGRICREFEASVDGRDGKTIGLGCRAADGSWRTEIAARGGGAAGTYGAASGAGVVEGALAELGSAGPLGAPEEDALLKAGWVSPR